MRRQQSTASDFDVGPAVHPAGRGARVGRWSPREWSRMRGWVRPATPEEMALSGSATLNTQIWFSQFPLRPTAGWAAVAALLAAGWLLGPLRLDWRVVALLLLLADPLWGGIWRLAAGRQEMLPLQAPSARHSVWLPYLEPGSPAARLLGWDDHGVLHLMLRVVLPTVALAAAVALVLGREALLLTLLVTVLSLGGWIGRHSVGHIPAALHSVVTVALPWLLALNLSGVTPAHEWWAAHVTLVGCWFLHNWGEGRSVHAPRDPLGMALLAAAEIGMLGLFVVARAPLWVALLTMLWLPTWLLVYRNQALQRLNFWWLVAMLLSGVALGQSL